MDASSLISLSTDDITLDCATSTTNECPSLPSCDWSTDRDSELSLPSADTDDDQPLLFEPISHSTPSKKQQSKSVCLSTAFTTAAAPPLSDSNSVALCRPVSSLDTVMGSNAIKAPSVQEWHLSTVLELNGCSPNCAIVVHGLTEFDVLRAHSLFSDKNTQEQNKWILEYFNTHCPSNPSTGEKLPKDLAYVIGGKTVCINVWLQVFSLSLSRFYRLRQECVKYEANPGLSYKKPRAQSSKTMDAIAWMEQYFERVGDKRPDKDGIYLPTCLTEKRLYELMLEQLGTEQCISASQFNKIFRNDFKNVTIPKECRFTKCDFCSLMKIEMCKAGNSKEKKKLRKLYDDHLAVQEQERQRYYTNRREAIENPRDSISVIVDGMDQNKTNLPHLTRIPKSCQNLWSLRSHLTGVKVHGGGVYCYYDFLQWSHDCNLTLGTLLHTLKCICKQRKLPPRLALQMDNCVRENKNKYVFAFMILLVELRVFDEIEVGFLMVGHTHEDIDQSFSCLSRYLHKHSATSLKGMIQATLASNHLVSEVYVPSCLHDIREWLSPHIDKIKYHTEPHIFLFKRSVASGKAVMFYKHWTHSSWEPSGNQGLALLKTIPTGSPLVLTPSLHKQDIEQMKKDLPKYDDTGVFTPEVKEEWEDFLGTFTDRFGKVPIEEPPWVLDEIRELIAKRPSSPPPVLPVLPEKVQKKASALKKCRQVVVGKQSAKRAVDGETQSVAKRTKVTESEENTENEEKLNNPVVGEVIALCCSEYELDLPQLGTLVSVNEDNSVTINWLIGTYSSAFRPWLKRGKQVQERFPRRAVLGGLTLTQERRLKKETIQLLKKLYNVVEFV